MFMFTNLLCVQYIYIVYCTVLYHKLPISVSDSIGIGPTVYDGRWKGGESMAVVANPVNDTLYFSLSSSTVYYRVSNFLRFS